jgi:hypothetical protein
VDLGITAVDSGTILASFDDIQRVAREVVFDDSIEEWGSGESEGKERLGGVWGQIEFA